MSFSRLTLGAMLVGATMFGMTALAQSNTDQSAASTSAATSAPASATTPATSAKPAHHKAAHHKAAMVVMVDINSADAATLAKVKGLSAKKAQAIVAYRTKNGNFKSLDDLKSITNAKGKSLFSDKSIKVLAHRLTVGDASSSSQSSTPQANQ